MTAAAARWPTKRLRFLTTIPQKSETGGIPDDTEVSFVPMEAIGENGQIETSRAKAIAEVRNGYSYFAEGDVVLAKITPCFENGKGAIARHLVNGVGFGTTELHVIRAGPDLDVRFLFYVTKTHQFRRLGEAEMYGAGGQKRVPESFVRDFRVHVPGLDEQRAIADFLDRETTTVDALIAKKTRFIELLNENRRALITHAVTKGLGPEAKMKDSGEKWLEEIPAHWDVVPSNRFFVEAKARAREEDEHLSATQKYGVIPLAEYERLEGRQVTHAEKNLEQRKHVEVDDSVISMRSFQGGIERVKARGCVRSSYVALVADERAHVGFFSYLFKSSAYIQGLQATAMFIRDGQDLNYNNFRQVKLPFPSTDEQSRIAEFLDLEISKNGAIIAKTEGAINKLIEYRSALVSAAIAGQIDVSNYRPQEAAALCQ